MAFWTKREQRNYRIKFTIHTSCCDSDSLCEWATATTANSSIMNGEMNGK